MNLLVPCCRPEAFTEAIHLTVQMLPLAVIHEVVDFVGNHKMEKKLKKSLWEKIAFYSLKLIC